MAIDVLDEVCYLLGSFGVSSDFINLFFFVLERHCACLCFFRICDGF